MKEKERQVIQYIDGYAWGVAPDGKTVCLGTETDIRAILANPKHHPKNPTIAQVIFAERKLTKEAAHKQIEEESKVKKQKEESHRKAVELGVAQETLLPRKPRNRA